MENKDVYFMQEALKEAVKARKKGEIPVGAIIVKDNNIIARGHNLKETKNSALQHAEIITINKANEKLKSWRLLDCTMYVTLEPCCMCAGALVNSRINRLVIATEDDKTGAFGSKIDINNIGLNHKIEVTKGICKVESSNLIKEFFKGLRDEKKKQKQCDKGKNINI